MSDKLFFDGWSGRRYISIEILKENAKTFLVRLLEDGKLAGRNRLGVKGQEIRVPKHVVAREQESMAFDENAEQHALEETWKAKSAEIDMESL